MSYTALDSIQWGGSPKIGVSFGYDSRRSGGAMQYRIYVTVSPLTGAAYFGYPIYLSVTVDGTAAAGGYTLKTASPSRWSDRIEYDSGWITVAGKGTTASLYIRLYSGSGSTRDDSYGYALPVERQESIGDFSLTAEDVTIGEEGTLTLVRPGYGYTFAFGYTFGTAAGTLAESALTAVSSTATRAVYRWAVPESLAEEIPEATWGTGTVEVKVYSGGTLLGSVSAPFTAYVPEALRPAAELTAWIANDNPVVRGWGICLQGVSRMQYTITAAAKGGAGIAEYRFRFAGQEAAGASGATGVIGAAGVATPTATVTDSRGRSVTVSDDPVKVFAYRAPAITEASVVRCDSEGAAKDDGTYIKVCCEASVSPVQGRNSVQVRARYRQMGGQWSGYTLLQNGVEMLLGGGLSAAASYEVELSAVDTVGTVRAVRYTTSTSQVTLHLRSGGKGAAFGKYSEAEALECAWPAVFYGDVAIQGALTVDGKTLEDAIFPVGSVHFTAGEQPPVTAAECTWESVAAGIEGVYGWRRVT